MVCSILVTDDEDAGRECVVLQVDSERQRFDHISNDAYTTARTENGMYDIRHATTQHSVISMGNSVVNEKDRDQTGI